MTVGDNDDALKRFAVHVLEALAGKEEWDSDMLDEIAETANSFGLSHLDGDGWFRSDFYISGDEVIEGNPDDFDAERSVLVCANSWSSLRQMDVHRLFGSYDHENWAAINKCLKRHRPELAHEASEAMADLEADMHSSGGRVS